VHEEWNEFIEENFNIFLPHGALETDKCQ
jgi:hypothetical protein